MNDRPGKNLFFEGQVLHFAGLAVLLAAVFGASGLRGFQTGAFLGISTLTWAALAVGDAVLHQIYVWLCWRAELHRQRLTRLLDVRAFPIYAILFAILILLRSY